MRGKLNQQNKEVVEKYQRYHSSAMAEHDLDNKEQMITEEPDESNMDQQNTQRDEYMQEGQAVDPDLI